MSLPTSTPPTDLLKQKKVYERQLAAFVDKNEDYALLDFPNYFNIGDSIIYLGELACFDRLWGRKPRVVCDVSMPTTTLARYDMPKRILLQGGGNFGDIWKNHQNFRLDVLAAYKGHMIVQLPQSIHFSETELLVKTARAIDAHGDFHLMVRDQQSFDFASKAFNCNVQLVPDAACMLAGTVTASSAPSLDLLAMLRKDREAKDASLSSLLPANTQIEDWVDIEVWTLARRIFNKVFVKTMPSKNLSMRGREKLFRNFASARVAAGIEQLSRAEIIVTDRLHVHLLCCLMNKPHVVYDNHYGKITNYMTAWEDNQIAFPISTPSELGAALEAARTALSAYSDASFGRA